MKDEWVSPAEKLAARILQMPKSNGREKRSIPKAARLIEEYAEFQCDAIYNLFRKPLEVLRPLEALWREENSPDKFVLPDTTTFLKWIKEKADATLNNKIEIPVAPPPFCTCKQDKGLSKDDFGRPFCINCGRFLEK